MVTGHGLERYLAHFPALEELNMAETPLSEEFVRLHLAPRALRTQLNRDEPLPRAVDITCGACGRHLWRNLRHFAIAPPTQAHIDEGASSRLCSCLAFSSLALTRQARRMVHERAAVGRGCDAAHRRRRAQPELRAQLPRCVSAAKLSNSCPESGCTTFAAPFNLYLVDAGTGHVPLHGWRYAIAVGNGGAQLTGGRTAPRLAVITPVE